jgi:PAS domain S-box-containing protein
VTTLSGYTFSTLRESELVLYRGTCDGLDPILLVAPVAEDPPSTARLEHEYGLRAELDPDWAARPVALVRRDGRLSLVLEDPGGEPLDRLLGPPLDIAQFLRLAPTLVTAIRRAHESGLIHKDIKPANILVDQRGGGAWLTGFGIASRLPRERQAPAPPEVVTGTFAYMAPEQTGRMNRSVDARSDLYSLGVTLYQMLTGVLPFMATDPMDWIHCHIARRPMPPRERVTDVPDTVEAIILKLLAKSAEERYQSAAGLEADLRACLVAWERHRRIDPFPLGVHDVPDRLMIPETLYGRESDVGNLLAAYDRVVTRGVTELVLVSGHAGIGKSSLVNELHKALVAPRGLFAAGKFDQYKRNIPFATLAQAFQSLVRQILGTSDTEMGQWRARLLEALGPNGQLMVNLIPELALIVGEQPPVPDVSPRDQQARFQLVFRRFLGVFARPEHPLALFLDDLQWLDSATLDLLEHLATEPEVQHLLLVGAYRDNEVSASHPLAQMSARVRAASESVREIQLAPLLPTDVERLLADALHTASPRVRSLAALVFEKTAGNPFFTIQFLLDLAEGGLLAFDPDTAAWRWDLPRIRAKGFTDNVADLMTAKLGRLLPATQKALGQLACLGNVAETATLALVHGGADDAMHAALGDAVSAGLVQRSDGSYAFLHDRILEAAYALIADDERAQTHLRIGRLLAARTAPEALEEAIFDVVNQFDRAATLIVVPAEREQVAALNLMAGKRAKAASAYASALQYLAAGRALMAASGWEQCPDLTFDLELNLAECEYLNGDLVAAEARLAALSSRAPTAASSAAVTYLRLNLYTNLDRSNTAVAVGLEYLRRIDGSWSPHPTEAAVRQDYDRLWQLLGSRSTEALLASPVMTNTEQRATMDVLTALVSPAIFTDVNLFRLVISRMVICSLEHGNSDASSLAYSWLGALLATDRGDAGFRFGTLGLDLVEKRGLGRLRARVYLVFAAHVAHWTQPLATCRGFLRRAFEAAQEAGDFTYAAYSRFDLITNMIAAGEPLGDVEQEIEDALEFARKVRFGLMNDLFTTQLHLVRTLRGLTPNLGSFSDVTFDETRFQQHLEGNPQLVIAACRYWIRKLQAGVFANDTALAITSASKAAPLIWTAPTMVDLSEYHFYGALAQAACSDVASVEERPRHLEELTPHHKQITLWAENGRATFANRASLVGAEIARLEGRDLEAMRLYEQAIRSAREHGFVQNEGLANELAAHFYAVRGFETNADGHLRKAHSCYLRWGADGKVRQLERVHPQLRQEPLSPHPGGMTETSVEHLDLATVVKVSQAISSEIDLEKLVDTLLVIAVEHAGAERGLLILMRGDDPRIGAEATTVRDAVVVRFRQAEISPADLPTSVLRYVIRTGESLLLDDASNQKPFSADEYVVTNRSRSILCLPLIKQAKLVGVLYLENAQASHVFTPARVAILRLLSSQAAISLENANLYGDLQQTKAYLAAAQQLTHTGTFGWSVSSGTIYWSEEMYQIYGLDQATRLTLDQVLRLTHPDDMERVQQFIDRAPDGMEGWDFEYRLVTPEGVVKTLHTVAHAVTQESGEVEVIGAVMDITAAQAAQSALQTAQMQLAHATRVTTLGEMSASIAHEMNQPLAAIVLNGEAGLRWLAHEVPDVGEARDSLTRIVSGAYRASDVIRRIRNFSKKSRPEMIRLDINEVVGDVVTLVQREVIGHQATMQLQLAAGLPWVPGDRIQLQQVIINLVINGAQAMATVSGRARELLIRTQLHDADHVLVAIQDAGVGIDAEESKQLFSAFFTTKPNGLGMGLSICRSIVEAHGGQIWASRNAGPGMTFQFTLPADR